MHLDHLSYAAGSEGLGACAQRLGAQLGAGFRDGGLHPRFGTRNFVLPLDGDCYVEVVEALDHPAADRAPFGRAVRERSAEGGGWLGWVLAVDDLAAVETRLGRPSVPGQRRRPDGLVLEWRQIGVMDLTNDRQLPFFVQWRSDADVHPAVEDSPIRLQGLEIAGDPAAVAEHLGRPVDEVLSGVRVQWDEPDPGRGLEAATFDTPRGPVRID